MEADQKYFPIPKQQFQNHKKHANVQEVSILMVPREYFTETNAFHIYPTYQIDVRTIYQTLATTNCGSIQFATLELTPEVDKESVIEEPDENDKLSNVRFHLNIIPIYIPCNGTWDSGILFFKSKFMKHLATTKWGRNSI